MTATSDAEQTVVPPPTSKWRLRVAPILALLAMGTDLSAMLVVMGQLSAWPFAVAPMLHCAAAALTYAAARLLGPISILEFQAIVLTAMVVPVFGPALAWTFQANGATGSNDDDDPIENAHAHFERLESEEAYERNTLTGEFDADLAREVSAVSYAQILRQGTLQRRRNLLRSLGRIGTPAHVTVIRRCLYDDDPELRLCAHAELDRLARKHEERITKLRELAYPGEDETPATALDLSRLADACREYAASGIFDEEMAMFWRERAEAHARAAAELNPTDKRLARNQAEILLDLKNYEDAATILDALGDEENLANLAIRAEIAFARRDFTAIDTIARQFTEQFAPVPGWIEALTGRRSLDPRVGMFEEVE